MGRITWRSFRVADRVKKLGTDDAPIRAIPGKPFRAWREGRVGGAMSACKIAPNFDLAAEVPNPLISLRKIDIHGVMFRVQP